MLYVTKEITVIIFEDVIGFVLLQKLSWIC